MQRPMSSSRVQNRALCLPERPAEPTTAASRPAPRRHISRGYAGKPFAGEMHEITKRDRESVGSDGKVIAPSVSGCGHFQPGTRNVFGLNYQQTLKTAQHVRQAQFENRGEINKRSLPPRLIDAWGNMKRHDLLTTQVCANLYLRTVHNTNDIELHAGIGKPYHLPAQREGEPKRRCEIVTHKPRVAMPPRVLGHTGHLRDARSFVGVGFNQIQMAIDKEYAASNNYSNHRPLADKVSTVPDV